LEKIGVRPWLSIPRAARVLLLLVFLCGLAGCGRGKGEVTILNRTGKAIVQGELKIGDQIFPLSKIEPGKSQAVSFQSSHCGSCTYQISLTLSDHRQTIDSIGLVRRGMDYHDTLVVERKSLSLESIQNAPGDTNHFAKGSQTKKLKWIWLK